MRYARKLLAVVASVVAVSATMTTSGSAAASPSAGDEIFVVAVNDQAWSDAIIDVARQDPAYKEKANRLVSTWKNQVAAGKTVSLGSITEGNSRAERLRSLSALQDRLSHLKVVATDGAGAQPSGMATAQVNGWDPNSFPVRGYPGSGRTYWTGMQLIIAARYCNPSGCSADTDRFTCNVTVNPGAVTSKVSSNCLYFPNSGNFGNKHFRLWAINRGAIRGQSDTGDVTGGRVNYISSDRSLRGTVLTVAVTLWVYLNPFGYYTADGAKTADATCHTYDNVCVY